MFLPSLLLNIHGWNPSWLMRHPGPEEDVGERERWATCFLMHRLFLEMFTPNHLICIDNFLLCSAGIKEDYITHIHSPCIRISLSLSRSLSPPCTSVGHAEGHYFAQTMHLWWASALCDAGTCCTSLKLSFIVVIIWVFICMGVERAQARKSHVESVLLEVKLL